MQSSALLHYYLQQFSGRSCADSNGRPVKCHTAQNSPAPAPAISGHDTKLIKWDNCNRQPQPCQMSFCHWSLYSTFPLHLITSLIIWIFTWSDTRKKVTLHMVADGRQEDIEHKYHLFTCYSLNLMLDKTIRTGAQQIDVFILPPFQMPSRRRLNCSQAKSGSQKRNWPF